MIDNNTEWEVGSKLQFDLDPDKNYIMSVLTEYTYFWTDSDGKLQISQRNDPKAVVINTMVCKKHKDGDGVYVYIPVPETHRIIDEQSDFWKYCAKIKNKIKQLKTQKTQKHEEINKP